MKIKVHFFRDYVKFMGDLYHAAEIGCHGKDPRRCRACVSVAVAVVYSDSDPTNVSVGIAYRNPKDQFNRKMGRLISTNRAIKNFNEGLIINRDELEEFIRFSYDQGPKLPDGHSSRWHYFMEDRK
jgi:hypothetical protein